MDSCVKPARHESTSRNRKKSEEPKKNFGKNIYLIVLYMFFNFIFIFFSNMSECWLITNRSNRLLFGISEIMMTADLQALSRFHS